MQKKEWDTEAHKFVFSAVRAMMAVEPFYARLAFGLPWVQKDLNGLLYVTNGHTIFYDPKIVNEIKKNHVMGKSVFYALTRGGRSAEGMIAFDFLVSSTSSIIAKVALRHAFRAERMGESYKNAAIAASDLSAKHLVFNQDGRESVIPYNFNGEFADKFDWGAKNISFEGMAYQGGYLIEKDEKINPLGCAPCFPEEDPNKGDEGSEPHDCFGQPMPDGKAGAGNMSSEEMRGEVQDAIGQAMHSGKMAGEEPGKLEAQVQADMLGKRDWRDVLRKFLGGGAIPEQSWARPNRRFIADGLYLPGNPKEGPGEIVLAVDTSGSVDNALLNKFIAEVRKINEDMQPEKIYLIVCDNCIHSVTEFGPYDEVTCKVQGRGGTDFKPVFRWIRDNNKTPKAVVYFTDLEGDAGPQQRGYETLWVVWPGGETQAPWGELVMMED